MKSKEKIERNVIIVVFAIIYVLLFITVYACQIKDEKSPTRNTYVKDTVSVLTKEQIAQMEKNALESNIKMRNSTIVTITIPTSLDGGIKKQSEELYSLYDLEKENGILILFSQDEDEMVIKMPKKFKKCIDDSDIEKIIKQSEIKYEEDGEQILEVQKDVIDLVENEESIKDLLQRERILHYIFLAAEIIFLLFIFSFGGLIALTMILVFGYFLLDELRDYINKKRKKDEEEYDEDDD